MKQKPITKEANQQFKSDVTGNKSKLKNLSLYSLEFNDDDNNVGINDKNESIEKKIEKDSNKSESSTEKSDEQKNCVIRIEKRYEKHVEGKHCCADLSHI